MTGGTSSESSQSQEHTFCLNMIDRKSIASSLKLHLGLDVIHGVVVVLTEHVEPAGSDVHATYGGVGSLIELLLY